MLTHLFISNSVTALLKAQLWFNLTDLTPYWDRITTALTSVSNYASEDSEPLETWEIRGNKVGLPIRYGLRVAKQLGIKVIDLTSEGNHVDYDTYPTPRTAEQRRFFDTLLAVAQSAPSALVVAQTGTGKTVAALNTIANLKRTAIVVVPSKALAAQWKKEAILHIGLKPEEIHIFEGGDIKWVGFKLVIAVIHNLCNRDWPKEFYYYFGIAVWDEAHKVGATVFSQSIRKFPAHYRIALTATPNRKDGRSTILHNAFGLPSDSVAGNAMLAQPATVYVVATDCKVKSKPYGSTVMQIGGLISAVAKDEKRNKLGLAIVLKAAAKGRQILVISDRIDQLKWFRKELLAAGISKSNAELFIGGVPQDKVDRIKANCQIILATFGMMKEGQDVPRVDFGIDMTPRSEGEQAIGRIRRQHVGKTNNLWVTLLDLDASSLLKGISLSRIKDYKQCGASVVHVGTDINLIPY